MSGKYTVNNQFPKCTIDKKKYTSYKTQSKSWLGHKVPKSTGLSKVETATLLALFKSLSHKVVRTSSMSGAALFCILNYLDTRYFYSVLRTMAVVAVEECGFHNPATTMGLLNAIRGCDGVFKLSVGGHQHPLVVLKVFRRLWPHFAALTAEQPSSNEAVHRFTGEKVMIALKRYEKALAKTTAKAAVRPLGPKQNLGPSQMLAQRLQSKVYGGQVPAFQTPVAFRPFVSSEIRHESSEDFVKRCHSTSREIDSFIAKTKHRVATHGVYTKKYYIAIEELFEAMAPAISRRLTKPHMVDNIFEKLLKHCDAANMQYALTCKAFYYMQLKRNPESAEAVMYLAMCAQVATSPPITSTPTNAPDFGYVERAFNDVLGAGIEPSDQEAVQEALLKSLRILNESGPLAKLGHLTMDLHVTGSGHMRNDAGIQFFMEKSGKLYRKGDIPEVWSW